MFCFVLFHFLLQLSFVLIVVPFFCFHFQRYQRGLVATFLNMKLSISFRRGRSSDTPTEFTSQERMRSKLSRKQKSNKQCLIPRQTWKACMTHGRGRQGNVTLDCGPNGRHFLPPRVEILHGRTRLTVFSMWTISTTSFRKMDGDHTFWSLSLNRIHPNQWRIPRRRRAEHLFFGVGPISCH